jgi:Tol biopolymer transport system component
VQVTTHPGMDLNPAFSPQDDAMVYASDRTGSLELYVRDLGGSATETPLTDDGGQNGQPAWSPDGRLIAFHSKRRGGIWVMPARGGVPRQIAPSGSNPAWSPDGRRLAFQSDEHTDVAPNAYGAQSGSTIWTVDVDGRQVQQVTRSGRPIGGHSGPVWSRDARHIAFTVFEGGPYNGVWLLTLETGAVKALARGSGLYETVFAPDDSAIYVAGGEALIIRLAFDTSAATVGGPREMIPVAGVPGVRGLTISSDGARLGFAGLGLSSQIWAQPVSRDGTGTGEPRPLTSDTSRRNSFAVVSPDGLKVAYVSTRRGQEPNVWVMDIDGGNRVQITSDDATDGQPTWLLNGRLAYPSKRGEDRLFHSVDIDTRREELIFDAASAPGLKPGRVPMIGRLAEMQVARSLTKAVFSLVTPPAGRRVMYVTALDPIAPRALTDASQSVGYPAWSPDERWIGVEIKEGSSTHAGVIDIETGRMRQLTSERGQTWVRSWSPDGRKIAVAALRDGLWSLQWIDVESGRQGVITGTAPPQVYLRYPEWSPRGDVVVFERGELRGNIWTLALR